MCDKAPATTKDALRQVCKQAMMKGKGIAVFINMPKTAEPEIIVNASANVAEKLVYYNAAYDEELRLIANPQISIIKARAIDDELINELY